MKNLQIDNHFEVRVGVKVRVAQNGMTMSVVDFDNKSRKVFYDDDAVR